VQAFSASLIGKLIVFGYTWALLHHLVSGLRHFVWDPRLRLQGQRARGADLGALLAGVSLTVLVWIIAYAIGGGR